MFGRAFSTGRDTPRRRFIRRFFRHKLATVGVIFFCLIMCLTIFAPYIAAHDPNTIDLGNARKPPSKEHLFGTDQLGRDVFSRTLYGGRISILVGISATLISLVIGSALGASAGFFGGKLDMVIMRLTDMMLTFPQVIVCLVIISITGPGVDKVILVLGFLSWPSVCRLARGEVLALKNQMYVEAARALGASSGRIIVHHLLRNLMSILLVSVTMNIPNAILTEAGLSFLGVGVVPPVPSWGNLLNIARSFDMLQNSPWIWAPAGIFIVVTVLSFSFVGDGLNDALEGTAS